MFFKEKSAKEGISHVLDGDNHVYEEINRQDALGIVKSCLFGVMQNYEYLVYRAFIDSSAELGTVNMFSSRILAKLDAILCKITANPVAPDSDPFHSFCSTLVCYLLFL